MKIGTLHFFLFTALIWGNAPAFAQNIVADYSFEGFPGCVGEISWWSASNCNNCTSDWFPASGGTPDVLCASPRTGTKHGGIYVYTSGDKHEYFENKLGTPMIANNYYYVEMYIQLDPHSTLAIDEFGFYFSNGQYVDLTQGYALPLTPQVTDSKTGGYISNSNYTKISGCFMATGGEDHLIIGNFKSNATASITQLAGYTGNGSDVAYYYIDDVFVMRIDDVDWDLGDNADLCPGETITYSVAQNNATYLWQDGSTDSTYVASSSGTYWVEVTSNCQTKRDSVVVSTKDNCDNTIFFPNCFTPNGDNVNDVFTVAGSNLSYVNMKIYDRWGNLIFNSNSTNSAWNGNNVQQDVYVVLIDCGWNNGETQKYTSRVSVIK